jgi:hypothetical protein
MLGGMRYLRACFESRVVAASLLADSVEPTCLQKAASRLAAWNMARWSSSRNPGSVSGFFPSDMWVRAKATTVHPRFVVVQKMKSDVA